MKRLISLALCLVLMLSLAACGSNKMRSDYILNFDTGNSYAFTSKYPDFHVFRGDIKLKSKYGDVSITLCYYNDMDSTQHTPSKRQRLKPMKSRQWQTTKITACMPKLLSAKRNCLQAATRILFVRRELLILIPIPTAVPSHLTLAQATATPKG